MNHSGPVNFSLKSARCGQKDRLAVGRMGGCGTHHRERRTLRGTAQFDSMASLADQLLYGDEMVHSVGVVGMRYGIPKTTALSAYRAAATDE